MSPSKLKPGDKIRRIGIDATVFVFVERDPDKRHCILQCDKYKGLEGPDDQGLVVISDFDLARRYERAD